MATNWDEPTAQTSTPCGEQLCLRQLCSQATPTFAVADLRGAPGTRPPGSKFFHFHAVFGRKNKSSAFCHSAPRSRITTRVGRTSMYYQDSECHNKQFGFGTESGLTLPSMKSARHCLFWRPVCQDREVMTP